jgi:hypothetical protein
LLDDHVRACYQIVEQWSVLKVISFVEGARIMTKQTSSNEPVDRPALYYPYIHIRDENWLKGTLLAFQQVRRILPNKFTVKDEAITRPYAELKGPAGPLLEPVFVIAPEIETTQTWLRTRINERLDEIIVRYAEDQVPENLRGGPEAFQMHVGKILDQPLLELLKTKHLAWHSREPGEPDSHNWITMHPKLGAAMMSILALAIARLKGLSVVTVSGATHLELLANHENQVFEKLLEVPVPVGDISPSEVTVEELAHVILTIGFDLTRLTPQQICELLKEGKDLQSFRKTVATFASRIPAGLDAEEREKRLRIEAEAVLDAWNDYSGMLPSFAKEALVDATLDKAPDKAMEMGGLALGGAAASTVIGALPGLILSVAVTAGVNMFRKRDTPLRFLTKVNKVVDRSIGSIYVPQWSKLVGQAR